MEGFLDEWVNENKSFHYKLTGFVTYTYRYITRTGEGVDINANNFLTP